MAGGFISFYNVADGATLSAFNSQTYQAALPLANLQDRRVSKKARTSGSSANSFSFGVDLGAPKTLAIFALIGMNYQQPVEPDSGATNSYNTLSVVVKLSNVSIGATDAGQITQSYIDNVPYGLQPLVIVPLFNINGATISARYLSCVASWTTFGGATYFEAGRLWIGNAMNLPLGVDEAWSQTMKDTSQIVRSRGGQVYADQRAKFRLSKFKLTQLSRLQTFADVAAGGVTQPHIQEIAYTAGLGSEILVVPRSGALTSSDYQFMARTGCYGVINQEPVIENVSGDIYQTTLEVAESL